MDRPPAPTQRSRGLLVGAVAAIVLAGALAAGTASALLPYSVHVRVAPTTVAKGSNFRVSANGNSSNSSILVVFLAAKACATTATEERSLGAAEVISHPVVGLYLRSRTILAHVPGNHYACAYLIGTPPQSLLRGRASTAYVVTP